MTTSTKRSQKYPLMRLRSISLTNLAEDSSNEPSNESDETTTTNASLVCKDKENRRSVFLKTKMKDKVQSAECLSPEGNVSVKDYNQTRSFDEIHDDLKLREFIESPSYLHRRRSLSLTSIGVLGDQLDALRGGEGGKKKKVIQVVQHSLSNFKHRGWRRKSVSLGSERSVTKDDILDDLEKSSAEQHEEDKEVEKTKEQNEGVNVATSKIEALENEMSNTTSRSLELKQILKKIQDEIDDKIYQREQLQVRFDRQLRRWENFTELHQDEMTTMKTQVVHTVNRMESVEYRVYRRTTDLEEYVRNCEATIKEIRKQQHKQAGDGVEINGKVLLSKIVGVSVHMFAFLFRVISSTNKNLKYLFLSLMIITTIMMFRWILFSHD